MTVILLMRHGEKFEDELSEEGWIRAHYLSEYFLEHRPRGVSFPTHLISMKPNKPSSSRRCIDTLVPMMRDFRMTLHVEFKREEVKELVDYILNLPRDSVVLVCWEHHYIVNIAREFGFPVMNWNDTPITNDKDTKQFNILWKIKNNEFKSFLTFDIEQDGSSSVFLHPLRQEYTIKNYPWNFLSRQLSFWRAR
jgi:hypothetical protein